MSAVRFFSMFSACKQVSTWLVSSGFFGAGGSCRQPAGKSAIARLILRAAAMSAGDDLAPDDPLHAAVAATITTTRAVPGTPLTAGTGPAPWDEGPTGRPC